MKANGERHLDGKLGLVAEAQQRVEVDKVVSSRHGDDVAGEVRQQETPQVVAVHVHVRGETVGRHLRERERERGRRAGR